MARIKVESTEAVIVVELPVGSASGVLFAADSGSDAA